MEREKGFEPSASNLGIWSSIVYQELTSRTHTHPVDGGHRFFSESLFDRRRPSYRRTTYSPRIVSPERVGYKLSLKTESPGAARSLTRLVMAARNPHRSVICA